MQEDLTEKVFVWENVVEKQIYCNEFKDGADEYGYYAQSTTSSNTIGSVFLVSGK